MKVLLLQDNSYYTEDFPHVNYHKQTFLTSIDTSHISIVSDLGLSEPRTALSGNEVKKIGEYRHLVEITTKYKKDPIIVRLDFNSGHYKDFMSFLEYIGFKD